MTSPTDPLTIGSITLRNRIIRSATHEGLTEDNNPDRRMAELYGKLSDGGVGCIITGYAGISREGMAPTPNMMLIDDDSRIPEYAKLTDAVKGCGVPVILQIAHCGRQTREIITGYPTVAPSPIRDWLYNECVPHELTAEEIENIVNDFADAAERAMKAGFDGVQIHAAHGYLLSSFLSPHMNVRKDEYGGSTENRFRIIGMIASEIRRRLGDFTMMIKINGFERSRDGIRTDEAVSIAKLCESVGFDAIEVSCGMMEEGMVMCRGGLPFDAMFETNFRMRRLPGIVRSVAKPYIKRKMGSPEPMRLYNLDAAAAIRGNVDIPVIAVGGIRDVSDVECVLDRCDAASMSRPFVIDPGFTEKLLSGNGSKCTGCNRCLLYAECDTLKCHLR